MQRNLNCLFRSIRSQSQGVVSFFTSLNVRKRRGKIKYMSLQMPYTRRVRDRYDVGTMDMSRSTIRKKEQESKNGKNASLILGLGQTMIYQRCQRQKILFEAKKRRNNTMRVRREYNQDVICENRVGLRVTEKK